MIRENRLRKHPQTILEESSVRRTYHTDRHLAVYGTLAPGESNHHILGSIPGEWTPVELRGVRFTLQVGTDIGYPGYNWQPDGPTVDAYLLTSPKLPEHFDRLDRFEGPDYCRILVPVYRNGTMFAVANTYECRHTPAPF